MALKENIFSHGAPGRAEWIVSGGFEYLRADDVIANPGSGGSTFRTDQLGTGQHVPFAKLMSGTADDTAVIPGDATNGLFVQVKASALPTGAATAAKQPALGTAGSASADVLTVQGAASMTALKTDGSGVTQPVSDAGGSLTVDSPQLPAALVSGRLPVDGSAVTQPVSAASLPLPTGAATETTLAALNTKTATAKTSDYDTGAGTDTVPMMGIALPASGGAVQGGTATNPVRTDPTGTTAQPITDNGGSVTTDTPQLPSSLGQKTMANSVGVAIASDQGNLPANIAQINGVTPLMGNGASGTGAQRVTIANDSTGQVALSAGTAEIGNVKNSGTFAVQAAGAVASGSADSGNPVKVGGKYNATPPTIADGQRADLQTDANGYLKVNVAAGGASGGTSSSFGSADPGTGTAAGFSDGTNMREARVFDLDSGAGTQYGLGVNLRKIASGGSVEAGTSSDPLRTDPTGTTAQPITDNGGSLTTDSGQLPATLGQKAMSASMAVVVASDQSNLPANVAQINGVTPLMGAGATGTGSQRVTIATDGQGQVADNAAFTDGTTRLDMAGFIFDETAGTALTENDAAAARIDSKRALVFALEDATTRGQRQAVNAGGAAEVHGDVAHDAAVSGNPVRAAGRARTSDYTAVANDDTADFIADLNGKQIVLPYAIPENSISGVTAAITGTSDTSVIATPGAGIRNYITHILVTNSHATVGTVVEIKDNTTVIYRGYAAPAGGGFALNFPVPLRLTANVALQAANVTTGSNTYVSASGFKAP